MEEGCLRVGEEQLVPVGVIDWVYDLDFQWNGFYLNLIFLDTDYADLKDYFIHRPLHSRHRVRRETLFFSFHQN